MTHIKQFLKKISISDINFPSLILLFNKLLKFDGLIIFDKFFNLEIPLNVDGLENDFLVPHHSWDNLEEYFSTGNMLTRLFNNNFDKFNNN